jgi:hypothetical protein
MCQGLTNASSVITGEQGSGVAVLRHLVSRLRQLDRTPGVARVRKASRGLLRMRRVEAVQQDGGQVTGQQERCAGSIHMVFVETMESGRRRTRHPKGAKRPCLIDRSTSPPMNVRNVRVTPLLSSVAFLSKTRTADQLEFFLSPDAAVSQWLTRRL